MTRGRPALVASDFWDASRGFSVVWAVHLGRRHGLFAALARTGAPCSSAALAKKTKLDGRAVGLWCDAASAFGLLSKKGGRFGLRRGLGPLLVDEHSQEFLGGHMDYLALRSLDFESFDDLFREGPRAGRPQRHLGEAFAAATTWDHTAFLEVLLPRAPPLRRALARGANVLDLGSGTGAFDLRVARAFPRTRFLGVDPDRKAVAEARARTAKEGLEARVSFAVGRGESMAHRERFDVVYVGEVLCADGHAARVLARCHDALKVGGHLVVAEGLIDEARPPGDPSNALVIAMQLEFALQPARFFTKGALRREIEAAGFKDMRLVGAGGGLFFLWARKGGLKAARRRTTGRAARAPRSPPPRRRPRG